MCTGCVYRTYRKCLSAHTGNVTFIAGTGFTVALALMAHAVFFVDKLPVQRSTSFMEFTFLWCCRRISWRYGYHYLSLFLAR